VRPAGKILCSAVGLALLPAIAFGQASEIPHAQEFSGPAWSPYLGGALIGVLTWLTFSFSKQAVGASTSYATAAGLFGKLVVPRHTQNLKYYRDNPPKLNWELVFIGATIIGAFLAAWHGAELTRQWVPPMWADRFGSDSLGGRGVAGVLGGVLMALGARLAGGCTSGHGISGTAQLNVGSWISLICFFIGGVVVANALYRL
jgi:uncharacterized membrane protein YedE/YeeE